MTRLLPFLALILLAFAAGAAWQQRARNSNSKANQQSECQDNDAGVGLLLWVPLGGAIVLALVAVLLTQLHD